MKGKPQPLQLHQISSQIVKACLTTFIFSKIASPQPNRKQSNKFATQPGRPE